MKTARFIFSLAFISTALAQPGVWYESGKEVPDRPYQKAKGGFGVQLQLTKNASFFTDWALPQTPKLEIAKTARAGDKVYSVLFFFGAGKDNNGDSEVSFAGRVLNPAGEPIQEFKDIRAIRGPNSSKEYDLCLSDGHVMISFSAAGDKGFYTFDLNVTDHVKKVILSLSQKVEFK